MPEGKRLKVTLLKSMNGRLATHKACVRGLGLRRVRQSRVIEDTQQNRGMINKVAYLLQIEEV
jgi:large subunit ribosomal protein L30